MLIADSLVMSISNNFNNKCQRDTPLLLLVDYYKMKIRVNV